MAGVAEDKWGHDGEKTQDGIETRHPRWDPDLQPYVTTGRKPKTGLKRHTGGLSRSGLNGHDGEKTQDGIET